MSSVRADTALDIALLASPLFFDDGHSHDAIDYFETDYRSNRCKNDCIDNELNYCISENMDGGYCCPLGVDCPKASICSEDNPSAPFMFKYMACPNEPACGTKYITPPMNGSIERSQDTYTYNFVVNDVCTYFV